MFNCIYCHYPMCRVKIFLPLVQTSPSSVHEEVGHCGQLESQLVCNCDLDLFWRALVFFKYVMQCTALMIGKYQSWFFWMSIANISVFFFTAASSESKRAHSLKFGFLEPVLHSAKGFSSWFQLTPWFRITKKIWQRSLIKTSLYDMTGCS